MKKFKFRLEPLLRYRAYLEEQKKLEVAKAGADVLECEQAIVRCQLAVDHTQTRLSADLESGVDATRFHLFCNYLSGLEQTTDLEQNKLQDLSALLAAKKEELAKQSVERKVIGNLKKRQKESYYTEMLKDEQKALDDTVILRHIRKMKNESGQSI